MPVRDQKVSLAIYRAIVTCRAFFRCDFGDIERKTGIKASTAAAIYGRAFWKAEIDDFHAILEQINAAPRPDPNSRIPKLVSLVQTFVTPF